MYSLLKGYWALWEPGPEPLQYILEVKPLRLASGCCMPTRLVRRLGMLDHATRHGLDRFFLRLLGEGRHDEVPERLIEP